MLNWRADFLLAMNTNLQCTDRICLNYGTCLNFGAFKSINEIVEICFCANGFFGPNCEYISDDLLLSILSEDTLSVNDDGDKSLKQSHIGKSRRRGRGESHGRGRARKGRGRGRRNWKNIEKKQTNIFNFCSGISFTVTFFLFRTPSVPVISTLVSAPPVYFPIFKIFRGPKQAPPCPPDLN